MRYRHYKNQTGKFPGRGWGWGSEGAWSGKAGSLETYVPQLKRVINKKTHCLGHSV